MKPFCPLITLCISFLVLIRPLAIHMQYNGNNGYYPGNYNQNGYYPYYGNGYGFCYVNTPYCCYNYIPPNFLSLLGPLLTQILRSLNLPNLANLLNTLQTTSPLAPGFLNGLNANNPPIFNAFNQLSNAYNGMDPTTQRMFQQFCAAMFPAFQNALGTFNAQPTPQFDQQYPNVANFLRSPGMRQFAQDPNPFASSGQIPPNGQAPAIQPPAAAGVQGPQPNPVGQLAGPGAAAPAGASGGGGGENDLLNGILGAVDRYASAANNAIAQGRK